MRLIDADALKEAFYNRHRTPDDEKYLRVPAEVVYQFIDNAPTVDYTEELIELKELRDTMEMIKKHYILVEKGVQDNPNDLMIGKVIGEKK